MEAPGPKIGPSPFQGLGSILGLGAVLEPIERGPTGPLEEASLARPKAEARRFRLGPHGAPIGAVLERPKGHGPEGSSL